jgi:hypothetical protein
MLYINVFLIKKYCAFKKRKSKNIKNKARRCSVAIIKLLDKEKILQKQQDENNKQLLQQQQDDDDDDDDDEEEEEATKVKQNNLLLQSQEKEKIVVNRRLSLFNSTRLASINSILREKQTEILQDNDSVKENVATIVNSENKGNDETIQNRRYFIIIIY